MQGADRAFAFASGMAAIAAVCRLVKAGEHIVAGDDLYGGTSRLLASVVPNAGIGVSNVDTTDIEYGHISCSKHCTLDLLSCRCCTGLATAAVAYHYVCQ